jgi:drug/metabolite transporter (DMT)-like permease
MTNPQAYALLALVTVIWAGNFPLAKAGLAELGPLTLTATRALVTAPAPLALAERPWATLPRAGWAGWGAVLYAAAFGTVSHIWYYRCVRVVGAGRAAVFTNLTPFVVIARSALTLGEPIRWYHLMGATVVLAGVVLATAR